MEYGSKHVAQRNIRTDENNVQVNQNSALQQQEDFRVGDV
jgi:hypothetical protein